jgi:hypothetical protein
MHVRDMDIDKIHSSASMSLVGIIRNGFSQRLI